MIGARTAPQGPRELTVRVPVSLRFPSIAPMSPLVIRGTALDGLSARACHSSKVSVERLLRRTASEPVEMSAGYPGLRDELSAYVNAEPRMDRDGSIAKVLREFAVYSRMLKAAESIPELSHNDFVELLLHIHRRLGAGANSFRARSVRTNPDAAGNQVIYPDHRHCMRLIRELHSFLAANVRQYPTLSAIVAYVGINQAHPFADGNGRTARTAYNLIMAVSGSRHFLPIYCFNTVCGGSLIIKVRRAMYGGDWGPLLAFFADATRLSDRIQREGGLPYPEREEA